MCVVVGVALPVQRWNKTEGVFLWDYSGIGIFGIDGICVLLGAIFGKDGISFRSFSS